LRWNDFEIKDAAFAGWFDNSRFAVWLRFHKWYKIFNTVTVSHCTMNE